MKVRHSKVKNTGLIFELLVKQVVSDSVNGIQESAAIDLIKKYFTKSSPLSRELKLYEFTIKNTNVGVAKAQEIVSVILEVATRLDREAVRKQRYNLVKEIKANFDETKFFGSKLPNYKPLAATYCLLEAHTNPSIVNPEVLIENKTTLLHFLSGVEPSEKEVKEQLIEEYAKYEEDLRLLSYKILLENFNGSYNNLLSDQKTLLKEFITNVDSTEKLRSVVNEEFAKVKRSLEVVAPIVDDKVVGLKLAEIANRIEGLGKEEEVGDNHLLILMQYHQLLHEVLVVK